MTVCRPEILPVLAVIGITEEAATAFSIPEPVLDDLADVAALLPEELIPPDVEIDDDGTAVLRWFSPDMRNSFSLTFLGLGSVTGYLSTERTDPAWKLTIADHALLAARLSDARVVGLIAGQQRNFAAPATLMVACRHTQ